MSVHARLWGLALIDSVSVLLTTAILFTNRLSQWTKNACIIAILYLLAVVLIVSLGLFGPGVLYLYGITVFMSIMFDKKYAYYSVAAHFFTCSVFAVMAWFRMAPFTDSELAGTWIAFSSNLIFLSVVTVMLVSTLINGLEVTVKRKNALTSTLRVQNEERQALNNQLTDSVSQYKVLFFNNPLPIWVIDPETLRFLEVNDAACRVYGYSRCEFLEITVCQINRNINKHGLLRLANNLITKHEPINATTTHWKKDQRNFEVKIEYNIIMYNGRKALLGIAEDISEQVKYVHAIEEQNRKLADIAFIQSHLVRAPLARILGLTDLICSEGICSGLDEVGYLRQSAKDLDEILIRIIDNTEQLPVIEPIERFCNRQ
jgi:PAS domain S-box-containing protein